MLQKLFSLLMILVSLGSGTLREYADQMNLGGYLFLVNRDYPLTADYVPEDLVIPDVKRASDAVLLRRDAAAGLEGLFTAGRPKKASGWPKTAGALASSSVTGMNGPM